MVNDLSTVSSDCPKFLHLEEVIQSCRSDGEYLLAALDNGSGSGSRCPETPDSRIISFCGFLPMLITLGPPVIQKIYEPPCDLLLNSFLPNLTRARKSDLCRGEILQNKNYMVPRKGAIKCNTKAFFSQWLRIITNSLMGRNWRLLMEHITSIFNCMLISLGKLV